MTHHRPAGSALSLHRLPLLLFLFALCCAPRGNIGRGSGARPAERRENVQIMELRDEAREPEKPAKINRAHALRMRERPPTPMCARFNLHRPNILRQNDLLRVLFSWRARVHFSFSLPVWGLTASAVAVEPFIFVSHAIPGEPRRATRRFSSDARGRRTLCPRSGNK